MRSIHSLHARPALHRRVRTFVLDAYASALTLIERSEAEGAAALDEDAAAELQELCEASWAALRHPHDSASDTAELTLRLALKLVQSSILEGQLEGVKDYHLLRDITNDLAILDTSTTQYLQKVSAPLHAYYAQAQAGSSAVSAAITVLHDNSLGSLVRIEVDASGASGTSKARGAAWTRQSGAFSQRVGSVEAGLHGGDALVPSLHAAEIGAALLSHFEASRQIADLSLSEVNSVFQGAVAKISERHLRLRGAPAASPVVAADVQTRCDGGEEVEGGDAAAVISPQDLPPRRAGDTSDRRLLVAAEGVEDDDSPDSTRERFRA